MRLKTVLVAAVMAVSSIGASVGAAAPAHAASAPLTKCSVSITNPSGRGSMYGPPYVQAVAVVSCVQGTGNVPLDGATIHGELSDVTANTHVFVTNTTSSSGSYQLSTGGVTLPWVTGHTYVLSGSAQAQPTGLSGWTGQYHSAPITPGA